MDEQLERWITLAAQLETIRLLSIAKDPLHHLQSRAF